MKLIIIPSHNFAHAIKAELQSLESGSLQQNL